MTVSADIAAATGTQATHILGDLVGFLLVWLCSVFVHDGSLEVQRTLASVLSHEYKFG